MKRKTVRKKPATAPVPLPRETDEPRNNAASAFPIVGIGASAGGLEALEQFLGHVPEGCGMAFVVIQHLDPDHTGILPELLQRITKMSVVQARDAMRVKPGSVYVIPPNKDLAIRHGVLYLHAPTASRGLRLPIDFFLRSLGDECSERSIGVILSGMGSDGVRGLRSIKERGGLALVQDPASAKFDSMPRSAIEGGLADIVALPEELPGRIMEYLRIVPPVEVPLADLPEHPQSSLKMITALLRTRTHHDFSLYKPTSLYRRIERRMGIHQIDTIASYTLFLKKNPHELDLLFKELLIGVTSFFRDPQMWEVLKTEVLPKILANRPEGCDLRAWSCGCSTGEEAYSLAMLFREVVDASISPVSCNLHIFATDLDPDAIDRARKGEFPVAISADVSAERLHRFFVHEDNKYRVRTEIRDMITFAQQNVIMDPPFSKLDILVCRNLMIYMSAELQKKLLPLFHYSLNPGGVLFLGSAEAVPGYSGLFTPSSPGSKIYQRVEQLLSQEQVSFPLSLTSSHPGMVKEYSMPKLDDNLQAMAEQVIIRHFSTPAVLVSDTGDIVYISGRTGKYLEPAAGKANLNIFAMARDGIRYELGSAFSKVLHQKGPVTVRSGLVEVNGARQAVDLTLLNIEEPEALRGMVMIVFRDVALPPKAKRKKSSDALFGGERTVELEQELLSIREELRTTREEMQTSQEEFRSMTEELQSTNEELQSTNEELTTSKEEMQSMNEELQTVNAEQTSRLEEFNREHDDMQNLLNSTEIAAVFLDGKLHVRRFTTGANKLFKLIPGDVGRPLTDIASNLNYPELYDHVQTVLRTLIFVENQVSTPDGRWFLVRIIPYRTMTNVIDGVVITCNDITAAKSVEAELRDQIARLK
jgi:two-component system CheB/CheR fusion protein